MRAQYKTEDMTKEDFHVIKHVKLQHALMLMGVVGLACAWKASDPISSGLSTPAAVWYSIGIFSAIMCVCTVQRCIPAS